jgi:hypothetical protein
MRCGKGRPASSWRRTADVGGRYGQNSAQGDPGRSSVEGSRRALLAAQLTQRWNQSVWDRVAQILQEPPLRPVPDATTKRLRQRQNRLNQDQVDALVDDYQSGLSIADVAKKHHVCIVTATSWLKVRGVEIRPKFSAVSP